MRTWKGALAAAWVIASVLGLTGCGGGGGSGDTGGGNSGGTVPGSATGLVPAAPAPGATLYADATTLLPLATGTTWHYRASSPIGTVPAYGVLVNVTAVDSNITVSRQSRRGDDDGTTTVSASGGTISATDPEGAPPGVPLTYTVLRSPVRANDQITIFDRTAVDSGTDVDGDGVADLVDFAVYSRVVGNEPVDLPDLQQTLTALRVDTTVLARFTASSSHQVLPTASYVLSEWYAPGVGIVRRTETEVAQGGPSTRIETDERLVYWKGIGQGMGALPPVVVRQNSSAPALGEPWSAVRSGDRVLVGTTLGSTLGPSDGFVLTALDADAKVQASHSYADLVSTAISPLLPTAEGVAVVSAESVVVNSRVSYQIRLRRFDRNASVTGSASGVVLIDQLLLASASAASDGSKIWLVWVDTTSDNGGTERLWVQDFGLDGTAISAARLLDSIHFSGFPLPQFQNISVSASADRVLVTWNHRAEGDLNATAMYALVRGANPPQVRALGVAQKPSGVSLVPLIATGGQAFMWSGLAGFAGYSGADDLLMRGLAIASDASVLRSSASTLDAEVLAASPARVNASGPSTDASLLYKATAFADGNQVLAAVATVGVMLPDVESLSSTYLLIDGWTAATPLAGTAPVVRQRRLEEFGFANASAFGTLRAVVPLDDRLLAFGSAPQGLTAAVIYRP